ncbi:PE-PGRS family protein, partial [Sorangium cellulosum]
MLSALGCAESSSIDGPYGPVSGTGGGSGAGGATSSSAATTTTSSSGSGAGASGATSTGGGDGGAGGEGGSGQGGSGDGGGGGEVVVDPCAMGCLPGTHDVDGNPLTGECGCEYACTPTSTSEDPIDGDFVDANCDGGDGLVEQCVYVSAGTGDDANPGTRNAPVQTIATAIQVAQEGAVPAVCLSGELYEEAVTVVSGISIYGGFDHNDPDFKFRRSPSVTTTVRATGTVFYARSIEQPTHIEGITIEALRSPSPGSSTYGVRLGGGLAELYVRYNQIDVEDGQKGADGTHGAAHSAGTAPAGNAGEEGCDYCEDATMGGSGGPAPTCAEPGGRGGIGGHNKGHGAAGSPGSRGAAGGAGGVAAGVCYTDSAPGRNGAAGATGAQGTPGTGGASLGSIASGVYRPANGTNGQNGANGGGGGGAGGGGGGACELPVWPNTCSCGEDGGGGGGSGG